MKIPKWVLIQIITIVLFTVVNNYSTYVADIKLTCAAAGIDDQDDMCIWLRQKQYDPARPFL